MGMQRAGESFVDIAWQCRYCVDNALMCWLRTLPKRPKARVLLGTRATESADGAGLGRLLSRADRAGGRLMAIVPDLRSGRRRTGVGAGTGGRFAASGARRSRSLPRSKRRPAIRTSRDDIDERILAGHPDKAGWTWWDA